MEEFFITLFSLIIGIVVLSASLAFPIMLLVNHVFNPYLLAFVFAVPHITFLKTFGLIIMINVLFRNFSTIEK